MAYNEDVNIAKLLNSLLTQDLINCELTEIVVVASGCTDNTEQIVKEYIQTDSRIILLTQKNREGKAAAINLWLSRLPTDIEICLMESADTIPAKDTVEKMIQPFLNPQIGMTGARPIPTNSPQTFMGFLAHLTWGLHHQIAMQFPKLGEMVAFRNLVKSIPQKTPVDEVSLEAEFNALNLDLKYIPDAIVYNSGPKNIRDFIKQRRRIYSGHLFVKKDLDYAPATMKGSLVFKEVLKIIEYTPRNIIWTIAAIWLEAWSRILGYYDFHVKKHLPYKWDIAKSTKELKSVDGNSAQNSSL